jgi:hypothetical protein
LLATRTERARTKAVGAALSFASAAIALAATPWHEPREPREPIPKPGPSKAKREARKRVKAARKASRR